MLLGRSFQSFGPHVEKDLSQTVLFILNGTDNLFLSSEDLNPVRLTGFSCSKSARYLGPDPLRHLYTKDNILKLMRCRTGSQCSSFKARVELSYFFFWRTNFAQMFCILCIFCSSWFVTP